MSHSESPMREQEYFKVDTVGNSKREYTTIRWDGCDWLSNYIKLYNFVLYYVIFFKQYLSIRYNMLKCSHLIIIDSNISIWSKNTSVTLRVHTSEAISNSMISKLP